MIKKYSRKKLLMFSSAALFLVLFPLFSSSFATMMSIRIMYFGLLTMAFSFLAGQLGLLSLMTPAFLGISAYTLAIFESRGILFFPYSAILGILFALLVAALLGVLVNKSKDVYFLMLTLVLGQIFWAIVLEWAAFTGGSDGIIGIRLPGLPGISLSGFQGSDTGFYYYALLVFILSFLGLLAITRSSFGVKMRGVRESESRMVMLGYNVFLIKWSAFMVSAFVASLAGILIVYYIGLISPDSITLGAAVQVKIASILGGMHSVVGAVFGTAIIQTLEVYLSGVTDRHRLIVGLFFLAVIMFGQQGIMGLLERITSKIGELNKSLSIRRTNK